MFGRGVRLRGKGMSLRRTGTGAPDAVRLLETLYVFGVRADYLQVFLETLRDEGVATAVHYWPLHEHEPPVDALGLLTLAGDDARFEGIVLPDPARDAARITLESALTLTAGLEARARVGAATRHVYRVGAGWLEEAALYEVALSWRRRNPVARVALTPALVRAIAYAATVETQAGDLDADDAETRRLRADLAAECVARSFDNALNRVQREFYAARMKTAPLRIAGNANFSRYDIDGTPMPAVRIEAETRDDLVAELRKRIEAMRRGGVFTAESAAKVLTVLDESVGIGDVSAQVQQLLKNASDMADDGSPPLPRLYFDRHLYAPLFVDQPFADRNGQLALFGSTESGVRLSPPALVESEARFVFDLREFWQAERNAPQWRDCEIYLLRNQSAGGLGFFAGADFRPDFFLWLKRDKRQTLCFVEPKGLGRAWPEAKIGLLAGLTQMSPPDLPLRGFTVTPTSLADIRKSRPHETVETLAAQHVLLQQPESGYIRIVLESLHAAVSQ
jgi:hypothetical protein